MGKAKNFRFVLGLSHVLSFLRLGGWLKVYWVKSVLNKHKKRDEWFLDDYSVNPYFGCPFNCVYCYIRGSKYGADMAKTLTAKINAPTILEKQLRLKAKKGEYGIILLSSSTEAYPPIEESLGLTRKILKTILKNRFPTHILTKSTLVLRDLDLLRKIDEKAVLPWDLKQKLRRGVIISFSISTLNKKLAEVVEPGAPPPKERLEAMKKNVGRRVFWLVWFLFLSYPTYPTLRRSWIGWLKLLRLMVQNLFWLGL